MPRCDRMMIMSGPLRSDAMRLSIDNDDGVAIFVLMMMTMIGEGVA
eukprot:CAMPEP_0197852862 /NCGR_PEP_ID=MMETSP1438-20131217/21570_1 /TAXON_ID=1461541 /ORGANISM="Pterosperma sp., Strain CCMP1384" /LENGTH=45 /DNA_ID= /DNA_START= /DNA_END= /DNA_ORIENTATION=